MNSDQLTRTEQEAIKLARSMTDDRLGLALVEATEGDIGDPRNLRRIGALAFVRARRLALDEERQV